MSFFDDLKANADSIRQEWADLWQAAGAGPITVDQANRTLDILWQRSHLDIIQYYPNMASYYPTVQKYTGRLASIKDLWWVDHATAGVNGWGTLAWFSSQLVAHALPFDDKTEAEQYAKKRGGNVEPHNGGWVVTWKGLACASTHFVVFTSGLPFMLIDPRQDGCWGEPKRNGDGIHVEQVNALVVYLKGQEWRFWAGALPNDILKSQPPVALDKPFRGATAMLPYAWEQAVANIKLKRVCIAATGGRLVPERMSQHTDWRESKFDMGPLWPFAACNRAAFEQYDVESYGFVQNFEHAGQADITVDELKALADWAADPNVRHDLADDDTSIETTKEIQQALVKLYGPGMLPQYGADGQSGAETAAAVRVFQGDWNRTHTADRILIDGIPGVQTCLRLEKALAGDSSFKTT
jgi:hypothetical protein